MLNHSCHPRNPSACAGGGGGSAWDAWARGALAAALAAAPLDLSAMWAVAVRYGVHGLLHAGGGGGGGAGAAPAPEGASLGMTPAPNPSPGLGPLLELVAAPVPAGAPEHTRALFKNTRVAAFACPGSVCADVKRCGALPGAPSSAVVRRLKLLTQCAAELSSAGSVAVCAAAAAAVGRFQAAVLAELPALAAEPGEAVRQHAAECGARPRPPARQQRRNPPTVGRCADLAEPLMLAASARIRAKPEALLSACVAEHAVAAAIQGRATPALLRALRRGGALLRRAAPPLSGRCGAVLASWLLAEPAAPSAAPAAGASAAAADRSDAMDVDAGPAGAPAASARGAGEGAPLRARAEAFLRGVVAGMEVRRQGCAAPAGSAVPARDKAEASIEMLQICCAWYLRRGGEMLQICWLCALPR